MMFLLKTPFFAQAAGGGSSMGPIIMMLGFVVIFYFFMIRPQMAKQKKDKAFREGLKKDDKVITIGGVYGRIVSLEDQQVLLEVDKDVKIRVERSAIRSYAGNGSN
jgi:preprotein translocase subunit YajC